MSGGAAAAPAPEWLEWWRAFRRPAFWMPVADAFAVLTAFSLPWSTSLVGIFSACWLGSAALIVDYPAYFRSLRQPVCALPFALFALAAIGTLWSTAPWNERVHGLGPALKLLFLPGLFHYFERSNRGMWVFVAFLASCTLMMVMSWLVLFEPGISLQQDRPQRGIFVKNYIAQSQEFALCALALAYPISKLLRDRRIWPALSLVAVALGLVFTMIFVVVSRTAMVAMPILLAVFAVLYLRWRTNAMIFAACALLAGLAWLSSPQLRTTIDSFYSQYELYKDNDTPTSLGLRLEFWQKSLHFVREAPLVGHGTGSTRKLFEQAAIGSSDSLASGNVIDNPHNQTLNVAVQWGVIGVFVLWAMWISHLLLFRGDGFVAWIGFLVVMQNMLTSLFNSHIFDFHEGWMYVIGVGVAGGMMMRQRAGEAGELQ